jgi:hypothetical protein
MDINEKLDMILSKIEDIDSRLKKIETQSNEIHQYVPFVGWLDEKAKLISLNWDWISSSLLENIKINKTIEN